MSAGPTERLAKDRVSPGDVRDGGDRDDRAARAAVERRVLRREGSVSRSGAAAVVAVIALLVALGVLAAGVAGLLGERIGVFDPRAAAAAVPVLPQQTMPWVLAVIGVAAMVVGVFVLALGVLPKRRPRHVARAERLAVIIDDEVIASALARAARSRTRLGPEASVASVGRSTADVVLRPPAGLDVPAVAATGAVEDELTSIGAEPPITARLRVLPTGRVGG
ncbi:hypothetical protein [Curtobacterium ammoniigenes]|uniref:hypothetical protein n=1 Tax=Curtobacterium ammoniigenes TaxID=395387 RepID=UPI00082BE155|nr:hypothetical protein [Curtobacterium ammoniigenes]